MRNQNSFLAELHDAIASCDDEESIKVVRKALKEGLDPCQLITVAIEAIREVGESYEAGKIYIPDLMLAGQGMQEVMALATEEIVKSGRKPITKGVIMIGTVEGDLHNIGKDLVCTMLRAAGFQVHDMGVDVSASRFLSAAEDFQPDIIGLSALMSTTMREQGSVIEYFKARRIRNRYKIMIGGGVITQDWADEIRADGYAADAAGAVKLVEDFLKK